MNDPSGPRLARHDDMNVEQKHFKRLQEDQWLNDDLKNFHIALGTDQFITRKAKASLHHLHLWNKLIKKGEGCNYDSVQRSTKATRLANKRLSEMRSAFELD